MNKAIELFEQIEDADENKYHKTRTIIFDKDDMQFLREAKAELEAQEEKLNCYSAIVGSKNEEIALLKDKIKEFETQVNQNCNGCELRTYDAYALGDLVCSLNGHCKRAYPDKYK